MKIDRLNGLAIFLFSSAALAAGGGMSLDKLPTAAQATIKANTANAKILSIKHEEKDDDEEEHGKGKDEADEFEVETLLNGKSHDLVVDKKGRLLSVEDEWDLATVPSKAQATIRKEAGTAAIVRVEKVTEGQDVSYEAEISPASHGKKFEVRVREDGTLVSKHEDDEDKD